MQLDCAPRRAQFLLKPPASRNETGSLMAACSGPWIPERSATRLREADLNVLSKLGNQGLEWRLEPEAFTGGEVGREDDLLDVLVGCPVDIQVARQPSTQTSIGVFDAAFLP